LLSFHDRFAKDVTRRSTILILGDARNNYHQAHAEVIADLKYRAKAVYWLNPSRRPTGTAGLDREPVRAVLREGHRVSHAAPVGDVVGELA